MKKQSLNRLLAFFLFIALLSISLFSGCVQRRLPDDPNTQIRTDVYDGMNRSYRIFVPDSYNYSEPNGLVFVLHGGSGQGVNMENGLTRQGMNAIGELFNFVIVYPDGINERWNDGRFIVGANESLYGTDDVGFLLSLIDKLSDEFEIQPGGVFFTGISNGGFMSFRMGFEYPEKICAIAPVTATNAVDILNNFSAKGPISVLMMCGTQDPLVPYEGGWIHIFNRTRSLITSVNDTVDFWVEQNGCNSSAEIVELPDEDPDDETRVVVERYLDGCNGTVVVLYSILGGGHTWPGGLQYYPEWLIGRTCRDIDANTVIGQFFNEQRQRII